MIKIQKIASICAASLIGLNIVNFHTIKATEIPEKIIKNAKEYNLESSDKVATRNSISRMLESSASNRIFLFMRICQLISGVSTKDLLLQLKIFTSSNTKFLTIHYSENHQLKDIIQIARTDTEKIKLKSLFEPLHEENLELWFNDFFRQKDCPVNFESLNSRTIINIDSCSYAKLMP